MGTKEQLLRLLEDSKGCYLSGEKMAAQLNVSRNSIWKAVKALRTEGYRINAATNRGYALSQENDLLSPQAIEGFLPPGHPFSVSVRKQVDSTNEEARRRALEGAPEGTVIAAESQRAGKGRQGKRFFSPSESGVYLSVVLRPDIVAEQAQLITCAAAVACAQAVENATGRKALIKWVNDIYCDGRKVAGILTEGAIDMESGRFDYAVLGIGLNVKPPAGGFPDGISDTAGALLENEGPAVRNMLAAEMLNRFWSLYERLPSCEFHSEYRRRCFLLGEHVVISRAGSRVRARAVDLTDDFKLMIELPDGTRRELSCGEASTSRA
ncbi:biotin--[acetyl-CoA-carboxylase] ligase [Gordonibacter sp. An230]|uniref:biotin--[acetyl-CoA-carboxylase] ligase n=1 Tax=Gordonibacter sp. An230 TaxID=1965592 RepID=UPI000B365E82|nr:biotin--[acetyl-CoA-carboxylase] ligase [Gordonibacter sp. An230]OUO88642.1 biotin--[acetyl-CoA-carboxylase] ligase [Gordonibacter sp. An230]